MSYSIFFTLQASFFQVLDFYYISHLLTQLWNLQNTPSLSPLFPLKLVLSCSRHVSTNPLKPSPFHCHRPTLYFTGITKPSPELAGQTPMLFSSWTVADSFFVCYLHLTVHSTCCYQTSFPKHSSDPVKTHSIFPPACHLNEKLTRDDPAYLPLSISSLLCNANIMFHTNQLAPCCFYRFIFCTLLFQKPFLAISPFFAL